MARIRTIKPEFPLSQSIGRLSRDARLAFIELWTIVDDEGRHRAASRMLASLLFPYDDDARDLMDGWLAELECNGFIVRYDVEGSDYLQVVNWLKHQKIDHPSKSKIPAPPDASENPREPSRGLAPDLVPSTLTIGSKEKIEKQKNEPLAGKRMHEDWEMPASWMADAEAQGCSPGDAGHQWSAFRDTWLQRKTWPEDWSAAWRGFLRNRPQRSKPSRAPTAQASKPAGAASDLVFIAKDTSEWKAWDRWGRANGKPNGYPAHAQVGTERGWRFPARWPPGHSDTVVTLDQFREGHAA